MSKQLALPITVSILAMVSFVLLGQQAGAQLARDSRAQVSLSADYSAMPSIGRLLPILN